MNNEIKEILNKLKNHIEHIRFANLTNYELRLFYDYIINLQEENEKLLKKSYSDDVIITKAVEWVKKNMYYFPRPDELLNILKGENNVKD